MIGCLTAFGWTRTPFYSRGGNVHECHHCVGVEQADTVESLRRSADACRQLMDMAVRRNGTYYLTYHRYARSEQVLACYPNFPEFLRLKKKYDPSERFLSDWYLHYKTMIRM